MSNADELAAALADAAASGSLEVLLAAGINPHDAYTNRQEVSSDGPVRNDAFLEGAYQANPQAPMSNLEHLSAATGRTIAELRVRFFTHGLAHGNLTFTWPAIQPPQQSGLNYLSIAHACTPHRSGFTGEGSEI